MHDGEQLFLLLRLLFFFRDVEDELVVFGDLLEGHRCWDLYDNRSGEVLGELRERASDLDHRDVHVCIVFV